MGSMSVGTDVLNPVILTDAIQGVFSQQDAFFGSLAVSMGLVEVNGSFDVNDPTRIGNQITVPNFGTIGDFNQNNDGNSVTFNKGASQTGDTGTISRDSLGIEISRWYRMNGVGDPYGETARQIMVSATRAMGAATMTAATTPGAPTRNVYSATNPVMVTPDLITDAITQFWGDEVDNAGGGIIAHSKSVAYLANLKTADGAYLLKQPDQPNMPFMLNGRPLIRSDRGLISGTTMGSVTSTGTTPPVLTVSGTPTGVFSLRVQAVLGGAIGTWKLQFSTDGGNTWSATLPSAASVPLTDTQVDSVVGTNGNTGLTLGIAAGTANTDNVWTSLPNLQVTTLVVAKGALAFWYNRAALQVLELPNIAADSVQRAIHLYRVALRRRRAPGMSKPGVIAIKHNVTAIV